MVALDDGEEALRLHQEKPFGLVVVDLQMPRMSGIRFLETLRQAPAAIQPPCVVLTGTVTDEVLDRRSELGIADQVDKPFGITALCDRLAAVLAERRA